jgi:uracil-DNA glycosylase
MLNTSPSEEGSPNAKICILGEAPARTEMRMGRPLVGPSGQLFEYCLHAAGIARRECYITNVFDFEVVKTRDGRHITTRDGDILWTNGKGLTELGVEQTEACVQRLNDCSSNVIVPLGGTALDFLFGDARIMKWRGSILESSRLSGRKVVPTIHPAASLRGQFLYRYMISSDFVRVKEESKTPDINIPDRKFWLDPTYNEVKEYLESCLQCGSVAFDIEVLNHQVSCIAFAKTPLNCMSIPFVTEGGMHRWTVEEEADIWVLISNVLGDESIEKIGQNIVFDIGFLFQQMGIFTRGKISDTMIAHHIIWPDLPKGLDFLCSMHTREPYYKDEGKLWSKPWQDLMLFWQYNAKDAATTMEVWENIQEELEPYLDTYKLTMDMFPALLYMMTIGLKVDKDKLKNTKSRVSKQLQEKQTRLTEIAEWDFNVNSPKQCQQYFYETKRVKPYLNRKTGNPTTDDNAMTRIIRKHNLPEARLVQEIRGLSKLQGTYLDVAIDKDDRVRCSYNPRGTTTGRLSSSKTVFGTGMNLQNLHSEFKGFLVSDDYEISNT